jgi:hypothetical protein
MLGVGCRMSDEFETRDNRFETRDYKKEIEKE